VGAVESIGRVLLSLALVLGLMWMLGRWARSRTNGKGNSKEALTVLARQQLSRNASVAVVKIADRALVLGVTDGQVSLLGDADLATMEATTSRPARHRTVPAATRSAGRDLDLSELGLDVQLEPSAANPPRRASHPAMRALEGSALSPATWTQVIHAVRERTVKR